MTSKIRFLHKFSVSIFFLIIFSKNILAQNTDILKPRQMIIIRPIVQMDFRQSFVKDAPITIYGGNLGVRIGDLDQITLGYYTLTSGAKQQYVVRNRLRLNTESNINIWYMSLNFTRYVVNNRYGEIGFPMEVGYGKSVEEYKNTAGRVLQTYNHEIFPTQAGILVHIKLTKWIGIKGSVGFRHTIIPPDVQKPAFAEDFNGLYYSYGAKLYLDNIYNSIKKRNKKTFFFPKNIE